MQGCISRYLVSYCKLLVASHSISHSLPAPPPSIHVDFKGLAIGPISFYITATGRWQIVQSITFDADLPFGHPREISALAPEEFFIIFLFVLPSRFPFCHFSFLFFSSFFTSFFHPLKNTLTINHNLQLRLAQYYDRSVDRHSVTHTHPCDDPSSLPHHITLTF